MSRPKKYETTLVSFFLLACSFCCFTLLVPCSICADIISHSIEWLVQQCPMFARWQGCLKYICFAIAVSCSLIAFAWLDQQSSLPVAHTIVTFHITVAPTWWSLILTSVQACAALLLTCLYAVYKITFLLLFCTSKFPLLAVSWFTISLYVWSAADIADSD